MRFYLLLGALLSLAMFNTASAQESGLSRFSLRSEFGAGAQLGGHQRGSLDYGSAIGWGVMPSVRLVEPLSIQARVAGVHYPTGGAQTEAGRVLSFGAGLRFDPRVGRTGRLVSDANANLSVTGGRRRAGLDLSIGYEFDAGSRFAVGPFVRYAHVFTTAADHPSDSKTIIAGVSVTLRPAERATVTTVEQSTEEIRMAPMAPIRGRQIVIRQPVHFATNQAEVLPQSRHILQEVANTMQAHPEIRHLAIHGHTDERHSAEYNQGLSERRAESVRQELIRMGVSPRRLSTRGFGESRPAASGYGDWANSENRRVEFHIR